MNAAYARSMLRASAMSNALKLTVLCENCGTPQRIDEQCFACGAVHGAQVRVVVQLLEPAEHVVLRFPVGAAREALLARRALAPQK